MAMTVSPPPPRTRRRRRWLLGLALLPFLAAAALWGCVAWRMHLAAVELAEAIAEADRLDPGWRIGDIEAQRAELPNDQNAALRILATVAKLPKYYLKFGFKNDRDALAPDVLAPPARLDGPQRAALAELLPSVAPLLPEGRALADNPAGRFPLSSLRPLFLSPNSDCSYYMQRLLPVLRFDLIDR